MPSFEDRIRQLDLEAAEREAQLVATKRAEDAEIRTIQGQAANLTPRLHEAYKMLWTLELPTKGRQKWTIGSNYRSYSPQWSYTNTFKDPRPGRSGKIKVQNGCFVRLQTTMRGSTVRAELRPTQLSAEPKSSGGRTVSPEMWCIYHGDDPVRSMIIGRDFSATGSIRTSRYATQETADLGTCVALGFPHSWTDGPIVRVTIEDALELVLDSIAAVVSKYRQLDHSQWPDTH